MEMDEEGLLRKLAEIGSGPGGATAGKADSGELYGLAEFFPLRCARLSSA